MLNVYFAHWPVEATLGEAMWGIFGGGYFSVGNHQQLPCLFFIGCNHNIQPPGKITIRCQSPGGNPMQHLHLRHHQPVRPYLEDLPAGRLRDAGHALRKPHRGSALSPLWLLHHLCRLGVLCHLWSCLCCSGVEGDGCSRF